MTPVKLAGRAIALSAISAVAVITTASPAAAAPGDRYWFYWAGPLLALAAIGLVAALGLGYYIRVIRPKYRGR